MQNKKVLAVDLGASSGRLFCVSLDNGKLNLDEIHRFNNAGIHVGDRFYTDILYILQEILIGLKKVYQKEEHIESIGIDSWGVDFAILDEDEELLSNPYHYRDVQSAGMQIEAKKLFGKRGLFMETGVQDMWYNTVYQMLGIKNRKPHFFDRSICFLMIPDILGFCLTGNKTIEYTIASTTQMYDVKNKKWSDLVMEGLGIAPKVFPKVIMTGESKGYVNSKIKKLAGIPEEENLRLIATAEHDSSSAAYAVPSGDDIGIFINSGTWSIIGSVIDEPIVTEEIYNKGYSNEGAAFGKIKLVKSIMGMWLIQELKKSWNRRGMREDYDFLINEAQEAMPFAHMINVDDEIFTAPLDMADAMNQYCTYTKQIPMETQGEFYRGVMESLAFKYREAVEDLEAIIGKTVGTIYLLGGAVQDKMFCRFIANATGKCVSAGPVEASVTGNALVQFRALGGLEEETEFKSIIQNSFDICYYEPEDEMLWNQMYNKYLEITGTAFRDSTLIADGGTR
ncbi:rhamnulokinase [Faecalicatena contorta]|uniref:rhamnulokinase n=1 Tax=Faecalicatena contorta TaxID=39482 RepID=UPI00189B4378|nr:rhamnulokinase family protein [Faecalicatena contorta]